MSRFLRLSGAFFAIAGGLIGLAMSLSVVYSDFGGLGGVLVGLLLFPLTYSLVPLYTLLTAGNWNLLMINYGTIIAAWLLDWIAGELERRADEYGFDPGDFHACFRDVSG